MHSYLLKKLLPFTLTFIIGAFIGGLFNTYRTGPAVWAWESRATPLLGHEGPFGYDRHRSCRMYRRDLVAETKPLVILLKPPADLTGLEARIGDINPVSVNVTFGADGKVQMVEPVGGLYGNVRGGGDRHAKLMWEAVERAARQPTRLKRACDAPAHLPRARRRALGLPRAPAARLGLRRRGPRHRPADTVGSDLDAGLRAARRVRHALDRRVDRSHAPAR